MKKWAFLIIGLALCVNAVVAIVGVAAGHLSILLGVMQAVWGVLGIYLIIKAVILFRGKRIDKMAKDTK